MSSDVQAALIGFGFVTRLVKFLAGLDQLTNFHTSLLFTQLCGMISAIVGLGLDASSLISQLEAGQAPTIYRERLDAVKMQIQERFIYIKELFNVQATQTLCLNRLQQMLFYPVVLESFYAALDEIPLFDENVDMPFNRFQRHFSRSIPNSTRYLVKDRPADVSPSLITNPVVLEPQIAAFLLG